MTTMQPEQQDRPVEPPREPVASAETARERDLAEQLAKAAFVLVIALGVAEQMRYRWGRAHLRAHRWWADVEHRSRDEMLRTELRTIAGELVPLIGSRVGRRQP